MKEGVSYGTVSYTHLDVYKRQLNGLKPYHYITYVLEKMKDLGPFPEKEAMQELLPWSASLPAFQYGINSSRPQTAGKNTVISTRRTSTLQMP